MKPRRLLSLLTSALCWFGCSGKQPGPGAEEDKLRTESLFCAEWAKAACNEDVVLACNGTRSGCLETQKSACQVLVPPGYSSDDAEGCLDAVADAYEDARLNAAELDVVLKLGGACGSLVDGGRSGGQSCSDTFECNGVDGYECVIKVGATEGTCQLPVEVGGGERCDDPEIVCEEGFFCDGSRCLSEGLAGDDPDPCTSDAMCSAELRCDVATDAAEGVCAPRLTNSEECRVDDDCASRICLGATRKVCASNVVLTVESSLCDALR